MFKIHELVLASEGRLLSGDSDKIVSGISIDSRKIKKGEAFIAFKGGNFDGHDFIPEAVKKGALCVIAEKPVKRIKGVALIRVKNSLESLGKIARYNRNRYNLPVIAVTGSSGKTTVKDMIARVLSEKFKVLSTQGTQNNHIGLPLTLLKLDDSYGAVVLELGTNHFGEIEYLSRIASANIGVITNIGPSHLKYFKSLKGVFKEKHALLKNLKKPAVAVLNADDLYLKKVLMNKGRSLFTIGVGIDNRADYQASQIHSVNGAYAFKVNKRLRFALGSLGYYNIYNSLTAIAIARIFGIGYGKIKSALEDFQAPAGRLEIIKRRGLRFIDSTYNSNPASLSYALDLLNSLKVKGRKIAVLGDMLELGKSSLALHKEAIEKALLVCDNLVAVGTLSSLSARAKKNKDKNIITCSNSLQARKALRRDLKVTDRDIILVKGSRGMKMEEVFR
ncbi:MAG: UDP-N-acetylmuramoyl-tripeptide--D-alanyl-D-alanine ligase [Candidatus Omnitrophota bacterium]